MQLPIYCFSFLFSKYIVCVYNVNACEIFLKSIKLKCDAFLLNLGLQIYSFCLKIFLFTRIFLRDQVRKL